jgi:hypothetical protein
MLQVVPLFPLILSAFMGSQTQLMQRHKQNGWVMDGLVDLNFEFKDLMLILITKVELNTKLEELFRDGG